MSDPTAPPHPRAPRLALFLFALYVALYLGFMLLTAHRPPAHSPHSAATPTIGSSR